MKPPRIRDFQALLERYRPWEGFDVCPDDRARPRVSLSHLAGALVVAPALGYSSLRSVDLFSHSPEAKKMGVAPVSDSLLEKLTPRIPLRVPGRELRQLYDRAAAKGLCTTRLTNPHRPTLQIGHADGTSFLGHFFSVLTASASVDLVAGLKEAPTAGDELSTTKALLREELRQNPFTFPELTTFDGKYVDFSFLREWKGYGKDFLVRVRGDDGRNLDLVRQIRQRIASGCSGVTQIQGVDLEANRAYRLVRVEGIHDERYGRPLLGFEVTVRILKGKDAGREEVHDGFTSACDLSAQDLWTVRKSHWRIETLFRTLKREFWSRHGYLKGAHEAQVVGTLACVSLNLLELYDYERGIRKSGNVVPAAPGKLSLRQVQRELERTLVRLATATTWGMN